MKGAILLNATEAAKFLNKNRSTLYRMVKKGKITPVTIGTATKLYNIKDLKKFIK